MILYRGNKVTGRWEISAEEIARRFWADRQYSPPVSLDRALRYFIAVDLDSSWDPEDAGELAEYERVFDVVRAAWPLPSISHRP